MQQALWDPVEPERLGSLDPRLHARVNGEVYRFATHRTLARFRHDPARWCGLLRDPVTGMRFLPDARSPRCEWAGTPWFFASDSTRAVFLRSPKTYEVKREI